MLPILPPYRPFGQPATGYVDIITPPATGDKITVNGVDYTFNTHFFGIGRSMFAVCQNLAEAIRGEVNNDGHIVRNPVAVVTAIAYGDVSGKPGARLLLIATEPGLGGNAITLTTNNALVFVVSGALLTGGTAGASSDTVVLAANGSVTATTLTQAYKTVASTSVPEAVGTGLVESLTLTAQKSRTTANTGNVWIGFSATNDTQLRLLTPGDSVTYVAVDGKKINLAAIFIDVATNGDGVLYETGN